jgi:hypothetical protein
VRPMTVDVGKADSYTIRNEGEWSKIFIEQGQRPDGTRWGYISFVSTFGNRGHVFSHIGPPSLEQFLIGCDWDYLAGKFWGLEREVFDFNASVKGLRKQVLLARRAGDLTKDEAFDCWCEISELEDCNNADWFAADIWFNQEHLAKHFCADGSPAMKRPNPQCEGFRDYIWRPFCDYLRAEAAKVAA